MCFKYQGHDVVGLIIHCPAQCRVFSVCSLLDMVSTHIVLNYCTYILLYVNPRAMFPNQGYANVSQGVLRIDFRFRK